APAREVLSLAGASGSAPATRPYNLNHRTPWLANPLRQFWLAFPVRWSGLECCYGAVGRITPGSRPARRARPARDPRRRRRAGRLARRARPAAVARQAGPPLDRRRPGRILRYDDRPAARPPRRTGRRLDTARHAGRPASALHRRHAKAAAAPA